MAYPASFVKATFSGSVAGEDIWSNSLSVDAATGTAAELFENLNPATLASAVQAFYCTGTVSMNQYNNLKTIKLALIGTDGKTIGEPKIYDYPTSPAGAATITTPPQDSIVISLLTAAVRGLAYRGRFYLPAGFADVQASTGRLSAASVTAVSSKVKTFLEAINTWAEAPVGSTGRLVVNSAVREGAARQVNAISVGNLVDNQRRRRNRLAEVYVDTALSL